MAHSDLRCRGQPSQPLHQLLHGRNIRISWSSARDSDLELATLLYAHYAHMGEAEILKTVCKSLLLVIIVQTAWPIVSADLER